MRLYRFIGATTTGIDLKNVEVKIKDNVAAFVVIKFGEGNFTYTRAKTYETKLDKGLIDTVVLGDEVPMDISFGGTWDYVRGDGVDVTVTDALYQENTASSWTSTADGVSGQECAPYCTDLELVNTPTCTSGIANPIETNTFVQFRADSVDYDVGAGTLSVSGKSNSTKPTSVRSA